MSVLNALSFYLARELKRGLRVDGYLSDYLLLLAATQTNNCQVSRALFLIYELLPHHEPKLYQQSPISHIYITKTTSFKIVFCIHNLILAHVKENHEKNSDCQILCDAG